MTKDEIAAINRRVAEHFKLWTPGQMCPSRGKCLYVYGDLRGFSWDDFDNTFYHDDNRHEIPPPDLLGADGFVRLLTQSKRMVGWSQVKNAWCGFTDNDIVCADTPQLALLLACDALRAKETDHD